MADVGRLSFDDRLIDHLPDFQRREWARRVTLHQLLTHTSGLSSDADETWPRNRQELANDDHGSAARVTRPLDTWLARTLRPAAEGLD